MFAFPWMLSLLLLVPALAWMLFGKRKKHAIPFSTLTFAARMQPTLRQRLLWLPKALLLVSIVLIIVSLARPRMGRERTVVTTEGIAIELIVDRSPSMEAMDFLIDEQPVDRLTAVKNVASRFVVGDDDLPGRTNDLIGLTIFSGYADNISPLTLDHPFVVSKLRTTEIVKLRSDAGTAIGDALASGVNKLTSLDERQRKKIKSKIAILLTDGENNFGELEPMEAAELAQAMDIKVYTIGVGTREGRAPIASSISGRQLFQSVPVSIDEETLTEVAELTGGKYFRATDTDSLEDIYAEIDRLEKTDVETNHIADYREWAVQPVREWTLLGYSMPPLLIMALAMLMTKLILERTWLREFHP